MKIAKTLTLMLAVAALVSGCGTVCDDAADVFEDCNVPMMTPVDPPVEGEEAMCDGETARVAQCAADHPDEACAAIEALARGEFVDNAYTMCANSGTI